MPSLPSTPRRLPSGHGTKSSILYLHSPTVRPRIQPQSKTKGCLTLRHQVQKPKSKNPIKGTEPYWRDGLADPVKFTVQKGAIPTHSLRACWILRQVAKSGEELLAPENHSNSTSMASTVFKTFASNNMWKRTIRSLAEVYQVAATNPWSDTTITFNARDEPKFRTARAPAALVLSLIVDGF